MTWGSRSQRPSGFLRRWFQRFADAFAGLWYATRTQESLWVHWAVAAVVLVTAGLLQLEPWRWCVLLLCIGHVIAAEIMNSAIETLIRSNFEQRTDGLANTLHQAAAAVLVSAGMAVIVGLVVLVPPLVTSLFSPVVAMSP